MTDRVAASIRVHYGQFGKAPRVALLHEPFNPELIVNWSISS
jgi:hypothetical protein